MDLVKTIIIESDLKRFRGVRMGFMARVICKMNEKKMINKMVVAVLLLDQRCDGGGEMRVAARVSRRRR